MYRAPAERDDCPACGSADIFDLDLLPMRAGRTGFVAGCEGCGLVFSNPQPTPTDLARFYSPAGDWGAERQQQADDNQPRPGRGGTWVRMFEPIHDVVNVTSPPAGASVLDYGCGDGKLLDALQDCGWTTYGIEPSLDVAFRRHRRLEGVPAAPAFDLIVTQHVLEHVPDPLAVLNRLAQACRAGGHLLIGVPRFDTLPLHRDYRYVLNGRAHITAYTWSCLRTLLARAGWQAVAEPPAEISKGGGGRQTRSRLRVIARRVEGAIAEPQRPADEARAAVRGYYAQGDSRPLLARAGWLRLAARAADRKRRRLKAARKAEAREHVAAPRSEAL